MSVVAEQHRLLQPEGRKKGAVMDQVEHYRSLYEEWQVTAVAAQAEATSLQLQLDRALSELAVQEDSLQSFNEQCNTLKTLVAAKDEKLQIFQQKLATIKAAVTKELDKQRIGDRDLRLTLDCILRCCHELRTCAITPEEFHLAINLILSTLTSHPPTPTTHISSQTAVFGEAGRKRLASLSCEERREQLARIAGSAPAEEVNEEMDPTPVQDSPTHLLAELQHHGYRELGSVVESGGPSESNDGSCSAVLVKEGVGERNGKEEEGEKEGEEEEEGEGEGVGEKEGEGEGEGGQAALGCGAMLETGGIVAEVSACTTPLDSRPRVQEDSELPMPTAGRVLQRRRRKVRSISADDPLMRGLSTEVESGSVQRGCVTFHPRPVMQLQAWRKKLGLREGSIFTGSLPDLEMSARGEGDEEEEDEEEYIDPREIASAIITPKLSRRMSQRLIRRMDTMMLQATPTYLKIVASNPAKNPSPLCVPAQRRLHRGAGGGSDPYLDGAVSNTEDDASSEDWDAKDGKRDMCNGYSTIPAAWQIPRNKERKIGMSKKLSVSMDERIYECIDDIALPLCDVGAKGGTSHQMPRKRHFTRRSRVTSSSRRRRFSKMKGTDGYELLDTPAESWSRLPGGPVLPKRKPALPPPRKTSAPPFRTFGAQSHMYVQQALSVPLDQPSASYSPAISSDENNQSDCETTPELFYTTPSFVTLESRPHPPDGEEGSKPLQRAHTSPFTYTTPTHCKLEQGGQQEQERVRGGGHKTLQSKKSHTLPASPSTPQHGPASKRVEHCGYLTKLDMRLRPGKKRWFVLSGTEFRYYRSKESSFGRPRKVINLNSWCKLAVVETVILKLTTSSRTYYLSAVSVEESEGWVRALLTVLRRPSEMPSPSRIPVSPPPDTATALSGWAHMTENGATRKIWCLLEDGALSMSPQPDDEPFQRMNLASSSVRKVRDSLLMDNKDSSTCLSSQLAIREDGHSLPVLLVPCNAEDKEKWFYQLSLASRSGRDETLELTPTEQYLATIFREGRALDHPLWKHPVLNMTDCPLRHSLTSLPSSSLTCKALRLFQNVQMFISTPLSRLALECHVAATHHIITTCQRYAQLQDELYCQLLRQLTGNLDQTSHSLQQGWCLLSLVIPMFLPHRPRVMWYLTAVLQRTLGSSRPLLIGFAQHCLDTVERVRDTGLRKWMPSFQELQGLLSDFAMDPTSLKTSLYLPVQLQDGTTQDLEFNASSTVSELLTQLNTKLGMPTSVESGFSLMSDWPGVEECAFFLLPPASKLGDLLACWWHAMEDLCPSGSGVRHRSIRLAYRNRLCVRGRRGQETEREAELLAYQISHEVVSGRHPVTHREGIKIAAIMAQLEYGDWERVGGGEDEEGESDGREAATAIAREALLKFGPMKFTQMTLEHDQSLYQRELVKQWKLCAGMSRAQCARIFLTLAQQWHLCGAALFLAELCSGKSVWLAVHEDGVSLLTHSSMEVCEVHGYDQLAAFGEDGDHLMLVTSSQPGSHSNSETEKLLLVMSKAKIHQATDLMTSYLENRKINYHFSVILQ